MAWGLRGRAGPLSLCWAPRAATLLVLNSEGPVSAPQGSGAEAAGAPPPAPPPALRPPRAQVSRRRFPGPSTDASPARALSSHPGRRQRSGDGCCRPPAEHPPATLPGVPRAHAHSRPHSGKRAGCSQAVPPRPHSPVTEAETGTGADPGLSLVGLGSLNVWSAAAETWA